MKRGGGGRGRGVSRTKSLRLCCAAELSEGTSFHTGSAVLVQTDTVCSISHSQSREKNEAGYSELSLGELHISRVCCLF